MAGGARLPVKSQKECMHRLQDNPFGSDWRRLACGLALTLLGLTSAVAQPANDNFDSAISLDFYSLLGTYPADNLGATLEVGEPTSATNSGGASVWFSWTAPA